MWAAGALRVVVRPTGGAPIVAPVHGAGTLAVGPVEITIGLEPARCTWSVRADLPVAIDAVAIEWDIDAGGHRPVVFSHGYQSWAPTRARRLGTDADPSRAPGSIPAVRAAYHADPGIAADGELRSEQVAIVDFGPTGRWCVGFRGGADHAGTIRVRLLEDGRVGVRAEAWLGGARVDSHEHRVLHDVIAFAGDDPSELLETWAAMVGSAESARVDAPFQVGWCSWYHYFHDVDERALHANLARASEWPFDVFQLDDGFQSSIGDWLTTNARFPGGVDGAATAIERAGFVPGLWLAPFLAAPDSELARTQPQMLARSIRDDRPALGMFHEVWGGAMWQLDTTHPEVVAHLEQTAAALLAMGYRYLKLDFTFSAAMPGRYHDPTRTPAERVRAGYDAIRRGAGNETFILACGAPLGAVVGVADGMRIGADVGPWWNPPRNAPALPGYEAAAPATAHAFVNTCTRAFAHRRLWLNDPDCVMLRTTRTALAEPAMRGWAQTVGASGGMVLVSDDLALLDNEAHTLLDEVVARGRAVDANARAGRSARALDLLNPAGPTGLGPGNSGRSVCLDPATGAVAGPRT